MNIVQRMEHWGDTHHPKWLAIVRIGLGIFLCYKGIQFLNNMSATLDLMTNRFSFGSFTTMLMSNYIAFAHILGGGLLILGMLTRFACLLQIPVMVGAVFFVNVSGDMYKPFSEWWLSLLVLLLLCGFLVLGNGPLSFKLVERKEKES